MRKKELSSKESRELEQIAAMPDDQIDTKDIPEARAENWAFARRGAFYKPIKQPVNIRIDADVLDWFKRRAEGRGYQTEINRVLRRHVIEHAMDHVIEKEKQR
ncbi:BrnA antitoxin family protein [Methylocystis sp.]|uniref:BrnA antitoxin family protein n=1 Tax=Methylocystis sp. TaxID=1911079 RepID=UPI003D0DFFCB